MVSQLVLLVLNYWGVGVCIVHIRITALDCVVKSSGDQSNVIEQLVTRIQSGAPEEGAMSPTGYKSLASQGV